VILITHRYEMELNVLDMQCGKRSEDVKAKGHLDIFCI